jgi:glycosyltransferase involved in cell wall biosynthesis
LPYPTDGGVWIRTYNILRELARVSDVTMLCFERLGTAKQSIDVEESLRRLRLLADVELFPLPQNHSRMVYLRNHAMSLALRRVYTRYVYESRPYRARIRSLVSERDFDLAHVDSLDLSSYLGDLGEIPIACTHHNVESSLLMRRSRVEGGRLGSRYFRIQAHLMEKEERLWCSRVAVNVMCSDQDAQVLRDVAPGSCVSVIPNGVDVDEFRPANTDGAGSVFVGATSWFPNLDALGHFAEDILPLVRRELPGHRVAWVGSADNAQRAHFEALGVHLTGYVDDVRPYMARAASFIVPLRVGGGTRLKILNAWSMGCAVVSTSIGCEGLEAIDGKNILIRDDPASFAKAVVEVELDPQLRARLGAEARRTAESVYSWAVIGRSLASLYRDVSAGASGLGAIESTTVGSGAVESGTAG